MKSSDLQKIREEAHKLREYAELEGSELGEVCIRLYALQQYSSHLSDELLFILAKEIKEQLEWFEENTKIVEETETYTRNIKKLVDND